MHVVNCHVERTYNLGNYESLKVGFEAVLNEQDRPLDVSRDLELLCNQHFENRTKQTVVYGQGKQTIQKAVEVTAKPAPQPQTPNTTCPRCGKPKKETYELCYLCFMDTKGDSQQ